MSKKKIGIIIGVLVLVLALVIGLIVVLATKGGSGNGNSTTGTEQVAENSSDGVSSGNNGENNNVSNNGNVNSGDNNQNDGNNQSGNGNGSAENLGNDSDSGANGTQNVGNSGNNSSSGNNSGNNSGSSGGSSSDISSDVAVQFKTSNSWDSDGKKFVQYELIVTNNSGSDVKEWSVKIPIVSGLSVSQKWNCTTSVSGSDLVISPESYNKTIAKGGSVSNIGLIVSTNSAHTISDYVVEADGQTSSGNNVVAGNNGSGSSGGNGSGGSSGGSSSNNSGSSSSGSSGSTDYTPATPPAAYGGLHVVGTDLVDATGKKIQLKGPSTHGLQWFPQYVNKDTFKTFRDDWGANVIRLAMYAREGGYVGGDQAKLKGLIDDGVKYATELGMYVIIDWHVLSYNPNETKSEAISFFDEISKKYDSYNNVIYEICNEPTGSEWNSQIKPYAESVISTIRKNDNDALIIVGTNTWSQDVDAVVGNKINDHNVMYALHFYAATHKDNIRNKLKTAIAGGVPVFVSECSICDASGNGGIDYDSANTWIKLMDEYNVSYIAWNISNKGESSALIQSGNSKLSGWTVDELSETGKWWRKIMRGEY